MLPPTALIAEPTRYRLSWSDVGLPAVGIPTVLLADCDARRLCCAVDEVGFHGTTATNQVPAPSKVKT